MNDSPKLLIVDDEEMIREYVEEALSLSDYCIYTADNIFDAKKKMAQENIDLLITDIQMNDGSGIDLVRDFRVTNPQVPTIIITGYPKTKYIKFIEDMEVDAFLTKPFSPDQIRYSVLKGLEKRKREIENEDIAELSNKNSELGLAGTSGYMFKLRKKIRDLAMGSFPVLIQGPTGTGKDIIANAIHACSSRRKNHIVTINCAAIPDHLEEAEFFGYKKGAFTGAYTDRNGIIAAADKSTLFLDEIGDLSPSVQAKLLRVLENKEFMRIGETVSHRVDIRIVTATNKNLKEMVEKGTFREDLYFRLGIIVTTKPLLDHSEDIPVLIKSFINKIRGDDCRCPGHITAEAMTTLVDHTWSGNIRELKQKISLLCHVAAGKKRINIEDVDAVFEKRTNGICCNDSYMDEKSKILHEFEIDFFTKLLKKYSGNISHASKASGMHRPNLIKKLKGLEIIADEFRDKE